MKSRGSTSRLYLILADLSTEEVGGISSVGVKSVDITKNTDGEGSQLGSY